MSDSQEPESWDDEFELDDPSPSNSRPRTSLNDDDDNDFGVWGDDDEDKTLTARSRPTRAPTPPPPVPPIPAALQSPVPSVFSSGSNNSTTHLRPTISRTSAGRASVGFANLPPSPPIHQERRRLKKKSRPPHEGVYEMQEYPMSDEDLPATTTPMGSPPTGSPLLQRIGSVKSRFSAKKKRASSTPSDVVLQEESTPRPSTPPHSKSWFFRPPDADPQSPKLRKRKSFGLVRKSDLPPDLEAELSNGYHQDRYGGLGLGRAGDDHKRERDRSREKDHQEGSRSWMGNMRRISIGTKHKRGLSVGTGEPPPPLLPPIELRPPSPFMDLSICHNQIPSDGTTASGGSTSPTRKTSAIHTSTTASLGRTTTATISNSSAVPRRNSLGDLKIPARISQAQVGLRRDLTLVREFAKSVDELKDLQATHADLVTQIQAILASSPPPPAPRAISPSIFRPRSRSNTTTRPNTLQALAADYYTINSKYHIAWECAELLIEMGGGGPPPPTSVSAPAMTVSASEPSRKSRERAITLNGDDRERENATPTPPPAAPTTPASWRASTGRNDLSQRQLVLLREMLNPVTPVPERSDSRISVNRDWRWGDAMSSTVTLPSEESSVPPSATPIAKKRRSSRLGMSGIRDMLKSLKKQANGSSSTSVSTTSGDSSGRQDGHMYAHGKVPTYGRRRAKTSSGPELMDPTSRPTTPYTNASLSSLNRPSPRRPSLASIFRIGKGSSSKNSVAEASRSNLDLQPTSSGSSAGRDDWDHMEDELGASGAGAGDTIRVRRGALFVDENRLSNVEEEGAKLPTALAMLKNASVRSMPEPRLAMTPENIKPLLENAREVKRRLGDCIEEMRALLDVHR
ncbi:hypothetical protein BDZ89DRAFT_1065627 [Hymenopellis radicata]|nr:hypothetical protein BDZ89DRAFT_1065627 [Hymenopellis radicata]